MKNDERTARRRGRREGWRQVIVTNDSTGFRSLPEGVEAQTPDVFLSNLLDLDAPLMIDLVEGQAAAMKKPPQSVEQLLAALARSRQNSWPIFDWRWRAVQGGGP